MKLNQLIHLCQVNSVNRLLKKKKEVNSVNHICTHRKVIKKKKNNNNNIKRKRQVWENLNPYEAITPLNQTDTFTQVIILEKFLQVFCEFVYF